MEWKGGIIHGGGVCDYLRGGTIHGSLRYVVLFDVVFRSSKYIYIYITGYKGEGKEAAQFSTTIVITAR